MANNKSRLITINKSGAGALTNYTHLINANTTSWGNLHTLGNDVRFYDAGHNLLNHFVLPIDYATIKNANTSFLVRIPTVAASGDTLITMEYGDGALTNVESGTNAFNVGGAGTPGFFDGFTVGGSAALDGTRWPSITGTWTEEDGPPKYAQNSAAVAGNIGGNVTINRTAGVRMIWRMQQSTIETTGVAMSCYWDTGTKYINFRAYNDGGIRKAQLLSEASVLATVNFNFANSTYYTFMGLIDAASPYPLTLYYDYITSPATNITANDNTDTGAGKMVHAKNTAGTYKLDWCGMCAYDSTVTTTSIGAETSLGPVIDQVVPSSGYQGQTVSVTITGANFVATPAVTFTKGAETIVATNEHFTSSAQIECDVPLDVAQTLGWWDCVVTNP